MAGDKPEKIPALQRRDSAWIHGLSANLGGVAGKGGSEPQSISRSRDLRQEPLAIGGIHENVHFAFQQKKNAGWFLRLADKNCRARAAEMRRERCKIALRFGGKILEESFGAARPTCVVPIRNRGPGHSELPPKRRFAISRPCFGEIALVAIGL